MRQIKLRQQVQSVIFIDEIDRVRSTSSIIAYKTKTRVAILVKETNGRFGFKYLEKFVYESRLYFEGSSVQESVNNALTKDGATRDIFIFETMDGFFDWATDNIS